jgi:hypothetical protein
MHHIVSDEWSAPIFQRELAELYKAIASGRPSPLTPLPVQYADFAHWQRQWLTGEVLDSQLGYWREQLANPPMLDLPTDTEHRTVWEMIATHIPFHPDDRQRIQDMTRDVLAGVPLPAKANLRTRWGRDHDRNSGYVPVALPLGPGTGESRASGTATQGVADLLA